MRIIFSEGPKSKKDVLKMLEKDNVLARFKSPFNAYAVLLAAGLYNFANISLQVGLNNISYIILLFVREMAAASIAVYGLARLYYIFVDTTLKRIVWYFLIVTAALNFAAFVEIATKWTENVLQRLN